MSNSLRSLRSRSSLPNHLPSNVRRFCIENQEGPPIRTIRRPFDFHASFRLKFRLPNSRDSGLRPVSIWTRAKCEWNHQKRRGDRQHESKTQRVRLRRNHSHQPRNQRTPDPCRTEKQRRQPRRVVLENCGQPGDRKSTRLNSSHSSISYAVFCLKKKKKTQ